MDKIGKNQNSMIFHDMNSNDKLFINTMYRYFYSLFFEKKEFKPFFKIILIIIETLQLISYSFSPIHYNSWKQDEKSIKMISDILSGFRLRLFFNYLKYNQFLIIYYIILIIIFILCLLVVLNLIFDKSTSKFHRISISIIHSLIDIITIIFYIPIIEILIIPIKCDNGKVYGFEDGESCWEIHHYVNFFLGILGILLLFIWSNFMIFFSFYPFQTSLSTIRITSNNDVIILYFKLFIIIQNLFISDQYISLIILLLISFFLFFTCYNNPTYNHNQIEAFINIRNLMTFWTYLVLLISIIFANVVANGFLYLLVFVYPMIIYLSFIIYKEKEYEDIDYSYNNNNLNDYLRKAKFNIKLVNSFIEEINQNMRNKNEAQKNITLLKGKIKFHCSLCTEYDCPLSKFINNEGNKNSQRQCLLNYINRFFIRGLKFFPNNFNILILFIDFNFRNKFNLNISKAYLTQLKKLNFGIKDKYIIYCLEQIIKNNNKIDLNIDNEKQNNIQIDSTELKYQKLKYLIENSLKYFSEFWGIFSTNISSKINTGKLYKIGEKLNIYLNEMNNLWENELKNKCISIECQNIAQLYSKFLLEVIWDQKKSKEISKKLNEENINNYNLQDNKKLDEKFNNKIESFVDNQDFLLYFEYDEKKNSRIIQISASYAFFLHFQKNELIGKEIKKILPNILIDEVYRYLDLSLKSINNQINIQNELENENDSNTIFYMSVIKNKMGYIFPIHYSYKILNDNDYSNSFIMKYKLENRQPKSEYAYFILTNPEFSIENISSSVIHLGLSLDLLKKYIVQINYLIKTNNDKEINNENYREYEEEPKEVKWVFPDIIYPKDNIQQRKEEEIEELIEKSKKKKLNLQIIPLQFSENGITAFVFKLTEIELKKGKKKLNEEIYIPKVDNNLIMFYLNKLNYIRAYVVEQKSHLRNLKNEEDEKDIKIKENYKSEMNKSNKNKRSSQMSEDESSENSEKNLIKLTKEKILELQANNFIEIKNFIFSLPIYGSDVSLEKFRPNRDKYSASKITEPLIKIHLTDFCKRIDEVAGIEKIIKRKNKKNINQNNTQTISPISINNDNYLSLENTSDEKVNSSSFVEKEDGNKGLLSDSSSSLSNIFKGNSIHYITYLFNLTFFLTLVLLLIEFLVTYNHLNKLESKIYYMNNGYKILNNIFYTKHFITEGVLTNSVSFYFPANVFGNPSTYLKDISKELSLIREELSKMYESLSSNDICKEYKIFLTNSKVEIYTITINTPEKLTLLFNNVMNRIFSSVNNLVSSPSSMVMENRDTYELMHNLLNNYFSYWYEVTNILTNDASEATKLKVPLLLIVFGYLFISIIVFIIFLQLLAKYSLEREKPINLFLTIKKVVFENLKNSAENFSNKLLNEFFGNGDNEQESQKEYKINIQEKDINIAKFKATNDNNSSIFKAFDFMIIIIIIIIYLLIYLIYFIIKYFNFRKNMENIEEMILLLDGFHISHADTIISVEIFKSFLFNKSIPILNEDNTLKEFILTFLTQTERFQDTVIYISKTKSFLGGNYLKKFQKYYLGDYSELLDKSFVELYSKSLDYLFKYGIRPIKIYIFEILRFLTIKYSISSEINARDDNISKIFKASDFKLMEINLMLESIIRKWYTGVIELMIYSYSDFHKQTRTLYIIFFICLIIISLIYYLIIWKIYQRKLNTLLKESTNLINLIPQGIKNIIIEKIVE